MLRRKFGYRSSIKTKEQPSHAFPIFFLYSIYLIYKDGSGKDAVKFIDILLVVVNLNSAKCPHHTIFPRKELT
jgi:hypothetical protein